VRHTSLKRNHKLKINKPLPGVAQFTAISFVHRTPLTDVKEAQKTRSTVIEKYGLHHPIKRYNHGQHPIPSVKTTAPA